MNVAFDAWIPVVTAAGTRRMASLISVLSERDSHADLAVRPHERVALMRLFLCVAHAALDGPKNYDDWRTVPDRLPHVAEAYLTRWKDSFELFHPTKPWLQMAGISSRPDAPPKKADWMPVQKLNFSFASGNNSTLFDHDGMSDRRQIPLPDTIVSMLTFQCFSTCGLISQVYWHGKQTKKTARDAPCVSASMVHALLRGTDLFESLHLNMPTYEDLRFYYPGRDPGRPVWELMPTSDKDSNAINNATDTYVGRLTPLARFILLDPTGERMLLGDGFVYKSFGDGFPAEPTATVVAREKGDKNGFSLLSFKPSIGLWRELSAMVVKRRAGQPGGPISLNSLQEGQACDLVVAALARDQASIIDVIESVFHVPSKLGTSEGAAAYEHEVRHAERWESRLGRAMESYRIEVDGGWEGRLKAAGPKKSELMEKLRITATTHYWTTIEKHLSLLMSHVEAIGTANADSTRENWRTLLFATACDAYRLACGQETPRQMRAFARGWQTLTS